MTIIIEAQKIPKGVLIIGFPSKSENVKLVALIKHPTKISMTNKPINAKNNCNSFGHLRMI
jgi:hypothetical protein